MCTSHTYKGNDAANVEKKKKIERVEGEKKKKKKHRTANILSKAKHCTRHSLTFFSSSFFLSLPTNITYTHTHTQGGKKKQQLRHVTNRLKKQYVVWARRERGRGGVLARFFRLMQEKYKKKKTQKTKAIVNVHQGNRSKHAAEREGGKKKEETVIIEKMQSTCQAKQHQQQQRQ